MRKSFVFGLVLLIVFVSPAFAATCTISQSGADSGTVMQGLPFTVEVSGLSGSGKVDIILPSSGFSLSEDTSKSFSSGTSSVSWTTVQANDILAGQTISATITVAGSPTTVTCNPNPFDVVSQPFISATISPSSVSVAKGSTFDVNLNIQNTGGTTARGVTISVSGTGMTKVSDTLSSEIVSSGNDAGILKVKANTAGTYTLTITISTTNGNTIQKQMTVTVSGGGAGAPGAGGAAGGAGGAAAMEITKNITKGLAAFKISMIASGQNMTLELEGADVAFKSLFIKMVKGANNAKVTIEKVAEPGVSKPKGKVYQYLKVDLENMTEDSIGDVDLEIEVDRSWINENNIVSVELQRWKNEKWERIPLTKESETSDKIMYKASFSGLSLFSVVGYTEEAAPILPEQNITNVTKEGKPPEVITGVKTVALAAIIIILLLAFAFFARKKKKK